MWRRSGSRAERLWGRSEAESVSVDVPAGRVLVVDDDQLNRMLLTRSLEQEGHHVGSAASGQEALEILREKPFDVVLLDIVMPELVVDDVLERTDEDLRLGGSRGIGTVMFTDISEFTAFTERTPPDRVIDLLNEYFGEMIDAI